MSRKSFFISMLALFISLAWVLEASACYLQSLPTQSLGVMFGRGSQGVGECE